MRILVKVLSEIDLSLVCTGALVFMIICQQVDSPSKKKTIALQNMKLKDNHSAVAM